MIFEFSTSEVGLVKYPYDVQLALILAFLVHLLVSESAGTTLRLDSKQGVSQGVSQEFSISTKWSAPKAVAVFAFI